MAPPKQRLFCSLLGLAAAADGRWREFHGSPSKSGQSPFVGPQSQPALKWRTQVGCTHWGTDCLLPGFTGTDSSPAIGPDGAVVIGSYDANIYSVDADSGAVRWKTATSEAFWSLGIESSPLVTDDNLVVVGSYDKSLWCVNGTTGEKVWTFKTGGSVASAPALDSELGHVYIGSTDHYLYSINVASGEQVWKYNAAGGEIWPPVMIDARNGWVCVGGGGNAIPTLEEHGTVHCVDQASGELVWSYETGSQIQSTPTIGPSTGTLFMGCYDHCLYALDSKAETADEDRLLWKQCTGGRLESSAAVHVDAAVGREIVVIGSADGSVYAWDSESGAPLWTVKTGAAEVISSPAIDSTGTVYIGADGVWAIDIADGSVKWHFTDSAIGFVGSSPALTEDGTLLVGCEDGYLYALHDEGMSAV